MAESLEIALQVAQTTGNGTVWTFRNSTQVTFICQGNGTISAGVVTYETALTPDYSGTWAAVASTVTPVSNTTIITRTLGPYPFVRARISTDVAGTTASVTIHAFGC